MPIFTPPPLSPDSELSQEKKQEYSGVFLVSRIRNCYTQMYEAYQECLEQLNNNKYGLTTIEIYEGMAPTDADEFYRLFQLLGTTLNGAMSGTITPEMTATSPAG